MHVFSGLAGPTIGIYCSGFGIRNCGPFRAQLKPVTFGHQDSISYLMPTRLSSSGSVSILQYLDTLLAQGD